MNQREKTLMYGVAAVVALLIAYQGYKSYAASLEKYRADKVNAEKDEMKLRVEVNKSTKAIQQLARWRDQSLPNDPKDPNSQELAAQQYNIWLESTLRKSRVNAQAITRLPKTTVTIPSIGTVGFSVSAPSVTLANVVDFLYNFYSAGILHQITRMDLVKDPTMLNQPNAPLRLTMQIEAMILPGASNTEKLPEEKVNAFKLASVDAYRTLIGERNIFSPYRPPGAPPTDVVVTTPEGTVDNSQFTKFTGATMGTDGLVAWIVVTSTGENKFVKTGESVKVDDWSTKIVSIEPRLLVIADAEGRESRVEIGNMLRAGRGGRGARGGGRGGRGGARGAGADGGVGRGGFDASALGGRGGGEAGALGGRGGGGRGGFGGRGGRGRGATEEAGGGERGAEPTGGGRGAEPASRGAGTPVETATGDAAS